MNLVIFYSIITFSYTKYFVHSYTVDVVFNSFLSCHCFQGHENTSLYPGLSCIVTSCRCHRSSKQYLPGSSCFRSLGHLPKYSLTSINITLNILAQTSTEIQLEQHRPTFTSDKVMIRPSFSLYYTKDEVKFCHYFLFNPIDLQRTLRYSMPDCSDTVQIIHVKQINDMHIHFNDMWEFLSYLHDNC